MMRDLHNNIEVRRGISPVSVADNTAQVSQIIDLANVFAFEWAILIGAVADVDATFTVLVEHGNAANLSDAGAVPDDYLLGTENGAGFQFDDDNEWRKIGYIGPMRYVRLTITPVNNAAAALLGALAILQRHRKGPQSSQAT